MMNAAKTLTGTCGAVALALPVATAIMLTVLPRSSHADDERAIIGEVTVTGVAATPAKAGEPTRISETASVGPAWWRIARC